jgi:hypothetical protein
MYFARRELRKSGSGREGNASFFEEKEAKRLFYSGAGVGGMTPMP